MYDYIFPYMDTLCQNSKTIYLGDYNFCNLTTEFCCAETRNNAKANPYLVQCCEDYYTNMYQSADLGLYGPNNVASFSSSGPTHDGRIKPDILAPGISAFSPFPFINLFQDNGLFLLELLLGENITVAIVLIIAAL